MKTTEANAILTCKMPAGVISMRAKFFSHLKPLRTGGYKELFKMKIERNGKWVKYIDKANSVDELVSVARRNGWEVSPA